MKQTALRAHEARVDAATPILPSHTKAAHQFTKVAEQPYLVVSQLSSSFFTGFTPTPKTS
jgi:hypothetical protein